MKFDLDPHNVFYRCVEDSNEAIMISDRQGVLRYVNPAWCDIYGYSREEAVGGTPRLLHSGMQSPEFYRDMWKRIQDPEDGHWKGELFNKAKDGRIIPVLLSITPYRNAEGEIRGYMGIALDMTQKKELEAKVAHQDRLASIGILSSGLAHEIGTPLGVVRGRAEYLMMMAPDATWKKNLEIITGQIDRISKLIRSLLRVSRSFKEIHFESVTVEQVVSEVITLVGQNLRQDSVETRILIPEGLKIRGDFGRLEQVLLNLVMNSIHAIRKAKAETPERTGHCLEIKAMEKDDRVCIEVRDTGCGISDLNLRRVFQPFFTTKDVGQGTGLGLAIVSQLIHEMEGNITVESRVGSHTVFRLCLLRGDAV